MERIGFIGLGVMGLPMAQRLVRAGYPVRVFDTDPKPVAVVEAAGGEAGRSVRDVSEQADLLISMLPRPEITREVLLGKDGAIGGLRKGAVYVDMSTSNPIVTREIHQALLARGVEMVDAPVSGGMSGAAAGTLMIMAGGEPQAVERVRPVLAVLGKKVTHVGGIGAGHTFKLINNLLFAVNMAAAAEAMVLGKKSGIDPVVLREVLKESSGQSYALDKKIKDFVFPRNFAPGFAVDLQMKDIDLAMQLAKDVEAPLLVAGTVRQIYQALMLKGYKKSDTSVVVKFFEELMGSEEVKGTP